MANPFEWFVEKVIRAPQDIGNFFGKLWGGLTGETTANAQKEANAANIAYQREVNAQNQYNLEHAHQIEVADLQAAGLNPWLAVGGGAQQANLQTTQVQAVDGSKMLQATSAALLLAALKIATKV